MKSFNLLFLFLISCSFLSAQKKEVGYLINSEEVKIPIYENPKEQGFSFSKIGAKCDCKFDNAKFYYFTKDGKVNKEKQSRIKFLEINPQSTICLTYKPRTVGSSTPYHEETLYIDIAHTATYLGLPFKKKLKTTVLQSVIVKNDKYMLTTYTPDSGESVAYIYTISNHQYMEGSQRTNAIGFTKKGKVFYAAIKKYFKDCPALIEQMKENEKYNEGVGAFKKIPLLSGVPGIECN